MKLTVEVYQDYVTISLPNGIEVAHWVESEWLEDPTLATTIAVAINMAHTNPIKFARMNIEHIRSQLEQCDTYFKDLRQHIGHDIECAYYGGEGEPINIVIECMTCNQVLFDISPGDYYEKVLSGEFVQLIEDIEKDIK